MCSFSSKSGLISLTPVTGFSSQVTVEFKFKAVLPELTKAVVGVVDVAVTVNVLRDEVLWFGIGDDDDNDKVDGCDDDDNADGDDEDNGKDVGK